MQTKSPRDPPRKRILGESWLTAYRRYIIKQEAPDIFHFWVGMTLISTALKRNVFIDRNAYQVYPNQYVFLVAKSGLCKKSSAMEIGLELIRKIEDITVIHGRATVEGLIDIMNKASADPNGVIKPDGSILLHADELAYLFGKASYITDLITFLTAAYTSKASLDFLTRNKGLAKVRNPCPTILAGTTPEQMGEIFPSIVLSSGFFARILLVWGSEVKRVAKPQIDKTMEDALVHDLGCIAQMCGEMKMLPDTDDYFNKWYDAMTPPDKPEMISFFQRRHDHVLKAAMAISASESSEMIITMNHLSAAIAAIEYVEERIPEAMKNIGATVASAIGDHIVNIIKLFDPNPVKHSVVMRRVYRRLTYGAQEFQQIIDTLKQAERIVESADGKGVTYKLSNIKH